MRKDQISRIGILAVVLLAPALGGTTERWSQALILLLIALLAGLLPPQRIDFPVAIAGAGLLTMAGLSFLPSRWLATPEWRTAALRSGIELPGTITPQSSITLHSIVLLVGCLLWFAWITGQQWSTHERRVLAKGFCAGAVLLAVIAIIAHSWDIAIPLWLKTERRFGPFPNRNQTGNFFAITALVCLAIAHENFHRRRRKWKAIIWGLAATILFWGLVESYSRAGIAIFFLGLAIWMLKVSTSYKRIALGSACILFLLTGFFLLGGETMARFQSYNYGDFRFKIWRDALSMIGAAPWLGTGLGTFEYLFPFFRNVSLQQQRIIHPESDWLWLAVEAGLPAVLFVFCGIATALRRVFPFEAKTARSLRAACATGVIIFMVHGFMDVSAHRFGTVIPAIFVLGLALMPPSGNRMALRFGPWAFRMAALAVFFSAVQMLRQKPQEKQLAGDLLQKHEYEAAVAHFSSALQETPLDWETYFLRGAAHAYLHQWMQAIGDFRRANLLEPISQRPPVQEAALWLRLKPPLAIPACREALRRCQFDEKADVFSEILNSAASMPEIVSSLGELARGDTQLELSYLRFASPERVAQIVARLLPQAYRLPQNRQKIVYFAAAYLKAEEKDFESAFLTARKGIISPPLPSLGEESLEQSQREFTLDPGNFAAAFLLYSAQMKEKRPEDALFTLEKASREKTPPVYLQLLTADLYAQLGRWEKAWETLQPLVH